jgi:hypothetical protein
LPPARPNRVGRGRNDAAAKMHINSTLSHHLHHLHCFPSASGGPFMQIHAISGHLCCSLPCGHYSRASFCHFGTGRISSLMSWRHSDTSPEATTSPELLSLLRPRCSSCTKCSHDTPARNVVTHMTHVICAPSPVTRHPAHVSHVM